MDLNGLVTGSEELLRGEGEVGRSLFQAAAGLASLRTVIAELDQEAAETFKGRGTTGRLNRALHEFDESRRIIKEATVRTYVWEAAEREHRQAELKHTQLREALKDKRTEQQRLQRIRTNLPLLAERAAKQEEADSLAHIPSLPAEGPQWRAAAQERLRSAEEAKRLAESRLAQFSAEAASLVVREGVLAQASAIEQTFHAIDGYRGARDSRPRLERERTDLSEQIRRLINEIDARCELTQAAGLLPPETLVSRVQSLIEEHTRLSDRDDQLAEQLRAKQAAVERLEIRLASLPESANLDELEISVSSVAHLPDLENRGRKLDRDLCDEAGRLQGEAAALWPGPLSELVVLRVPLTETAGTFEGEFAALAQEELLVSEKAAALSRDLEERRRELKVLAATGEVVTQAEVVAARAERDGKWSDLRNIHIDGASQPASQGAADRPVHALAAAFEEAIREADRLADLLRSDTARATNLEATRQRIADMQAEMQRNEEQHGLLAGKRQNLEQRWQVLIGPMRRSDLSPAALREWLSHHRRLIERHDNLESLRTERTSLDLDITRARRLLDTALLKCGLTVSTTDESAASVLARAQKAINAARKTRTDRDSVSEQIQASTGELRELQKSRQETAAKLTDWSRNWAEAAKALRLRNDALPAEAKTRLAQFARLSAAVDKLIGLDAEATEHGRVVREFEAKVASISRALAEAVDGTGSDTVAERLYGGLTDARRTEAKRQQAAKDIERETRTIEEAVIAAAHARTALDELVRQAGCQTVEELPDAEGKATRKQTLQQRLCEIDEHLVQHNARPVDEVLHEADGQTLEGIGRQMADAEAEIDGLERDIEAAQAALFSAKQHLDGIDGGTAAAEAQQAARSTAARIAKEARTYARVRLASALLNRVVQRYREQHQGPLLSRAAEIFTRITLGSFSGLTVDYDEDRQVLLGVRPDSTYVPVTGMSQGTRDQLFLSLRLAAIEQHVEGRGPFPVIVDDLLVQFDDDRALATLGMLRELSAKTQVLFFTHHKHLVELSEGSKLGTAICAQNL
ncbi:MAG: AAA family ATPase [Rhodocyclaceae bacterium]